MRFRLRVNWFKGLGVFFCSSDSGKRPKVCMPAASPTVTPAHAGSRPAAALEEPLAPSSLDPRFRGGDTVTCPARNLQFKARPPPFRGCRAPFHDFKGFRRHFGSCARGDSKRHAPRLVFTFRHNNFVRYDLPFCVSDARNNCSPDIRFSQENVDSCRYRAICPV